ncbi:MAG: biotin synthase BioB [Candidatus Binatia bacterium]|nr:biotin synthase BioB [Candidatus Binatia bacterium]
MSDFSALAEKSLAGAALSRAEAFSVMEAADERLPELLQAALQVRERFFGRKVKICVLQNARSGLCPEDCHYCSQSAISSAPIAKYRLLSTEELLAGARRAVAAGARRYCMVTSGRGPSERDIAHLSAAVRAIKAEFPSLEICLSLGLMSEGDARHLKAAGVGWINHNLNTSERFYPEICTTHTYADRVETVRNVQRAGLSTCCGGIIGMGETDADVIELAYALRALAVDSIPVNFLYPVAGTPLGERRDFSPSRGLKALCLMRFLNPRSEIRMAAGRELYLGEWGGLALYAANSIFVEGYLTTPGQRAVDAHKLIRDAGFELETVPAEYPA